MFTLDNVRVKLLIRKTAQLRSFNGCVANTFCLSICWHTYFWSCKLQSSITTKQNQQFRVFVANNKLKYHTDVFRIECLVQGSKLLLFFWIKTKMSSSYESTSFDLTCILCYFWVTEQKAWIFNLIYDELEKINIFYIFMFIISF